MDIKKKITVNGHEIAIVNSDEVCISDVQQISL
jgi:hypothetical protein